jgi:hypothetical protein
VFFHHCCGTGDEAPNPYLTAIVEILNAQGEQGWILVQVALREQDMICFWRRERPVPHSGAIVAKEE